MAARSTIKKPSARKTGRRSDPLRGARKGIGAHNRPQPLAPTTTPETFAGGALLPTVAAAARQSAQLPPFAPLLEELEVAGWSSHRRTLSGNFHDWMLLERRLLLVMAGHAASTDPLDPVEAALVAQGTWAAIRSHARHAADAGTLLSLTAQSLWPIANMGLQASVAVALVDLDGGQASVATAGDCLAMKIRASECEQVVVNQPAVGADCEYLYPSQSVQLSLRERIVLVADEASRRPAKLAAKIERSFSQLDAESHRRMMAADAVMLVRQFYDQPSKDDTRPTASVVAVRRH
ncbi:MAG TPA: SpoIIE family protein phosphatase [Lacipirellulaceae bacterium]|nr:SpoIIE family protein phosphatase [Lacipirellulaceae bacterium]